MLLTSSCYFLSPPVHEVLLAQVMQRMRLNALGSFVDSREKNIRTFGIVGLMYFLYVVIGNTTVSIQQQKYYRGEDAYIPALMHYLVVACFLLWFFVAAIRTRRNIRETYSIPGDVCEDCLLATCCPCCVGKLVRYDDIYL